MKKLRLKFFVPTFIVLTLVIGCFTFLNQVNAAPTTTGLQNPSTYSGNWSNPERALNDGGSGYATSASAGQQEKYGGYGFILPSSASIISVHVRLDTDRPWTVAKGDDIKLEVSIDGGATFLATTTTINIDSDWTTYTIDVTGWTSWTADKINNDKIWVRVTHVQVGLERDVYLDWIPIEVTYQVLTTTTTSLSKSAISLGASVTETASVRVASGSMQPSVTFIGSGYADINTGAGDGNALFPPYPSHLQVDDLILLQLTIRNSATTPPSIGNGFTLLYGPDSTGTTERQWIYYKFSTGSESGSLYISLGNLAVTSMARMYAFRYVELSSNFYEGGGFGSGSGSTISAQSVTTTGSNRLAVSFLFVTDDNALGSFTGESGGYDWTEMGNEYATTLGGQGTIQLQAATMGTAGTISGGSYSMGSSASWGVRSFALRPIVPTGAVTFYAKPEGGSWSAFDSKTLTSGSATSNAYTPTIAGTWYFKAVYSGYRYFAASPSGETDESLKVSSVVVHADSDWPMFHGDQSHSGYSISTAPSTNPTLWNHHTSGYVTSSPAVVDGVVYVGSNDCRVYALNASTGAEIWNYFTQHAPYIGGVTSSPAVVDGVVYVGSDYRYFYALNATTGAQIWNCTTGSIADCSPVVVSGVVYIGALNGSLYGLSASTGAVIWSSATGGSVSSPAVVDGVVYVGSGNFNVYAFNALTGALKWSYPTGNYVYGSPAVADGVVYIGSCDGKVYALNAETGALKWSYTTGAAVYSCPAPVNGVVYVGSTDSKIYALDATTGAEKWIYTTGGRVESSPAIVNGVLYVGSDDYSVYGLNASTGAKLWSFPTGGPVRSSPAVVNSVVYLGSYDFDVYALNAGDFSVTKHLTVNSEHGSPTSTATGDIGVGTVVTVSVASIVSGSDGVRYVCTGWTGTGSVPASGTGTSVTFTLMEDSTVTWNWKTQYYLTVSSAYGSAGGAAWYEDGAITYATLASTAVTGVPYIFTGWGGDASGINYVLTYFSSDAILMDGPKTATANWVNCDPAKWIHLLTTYVSTTPVLANDIIYAGAHYFLYALDASTGTEKWYYNTGMTSGAQGGVRSTPTIIDGVLYGGSDGPSKNVYAINATTGAEIWTYDTEGHVGYSSPAVANGFVYIGSTNCKLFALDAETGALKWTYQAGAAITDSPTVANGLVYFGSEDHKVYALNAETGALAWSYTTGHQIDFSTPAVVNGVVYIGSDDCKIYALDASTGAYKWSYTTEGFVQSSPTVVDGVVYVGSGDAYVYALNASTGVKIWSQITGYVRTTPAVADGIVYVSSINRNIYALDASTGTVIWSYATGDGVYSSPLVVDGIVYVGSGDGKLYAIKAGNWRPQLTVNSAYGSPTPTTGNICKGKVVIASVESVVSPVGGVAGVRYVCTGWTGTGSVPASGTGTSVTFTLMEDSTITWNWKTQYQVTFAVSPSGSGSTSPSGTSVWEDAGPLSITASVSSGYAFSSWSSTLSISFNNANSASAKATLNGPGTITANFAVSDTTPPTGSVSINSGSSYTKSTSVTLGLSASDPDDSVAQMRFSNDGSSWSSWESYATSKPWTLTTSDGAKTVYVQFKDSANNPSVSYSDGIILDTVAPSGSITSPTDGETKNSGSFTVSGSASDATSGVQKVEISVDSGSYDAVTSGTTSWSYSALGLADGSHTFKIMVTDNAGWTYESSQISVMVAHVLTVNTNPESIDSTTGGGTYAIGDAVSITAPEYYSIDSTSRYRFTSWTSSGGGSFDDASSPSTTFTMPAGDVTVTANYVTQYYLTVSDGGHGTPGGSGYYDDGATAYATITPLTVSGGSGVQYVFAGWTGDALGSGSPSDGITMDGAKTATATWTGEYELTMAQSPASAGASLSPAAGGGLWYAEGASVSISADENVGTSGSRYHFNGWTSGAGSFDSAFSASTDFTMPASAVMVTANYIGQYQVTFQYNVIGDASPNDPTVYYTKSGVPTTTLASTGTSVSDWVDAGTAVSYDNPLFEGSAQRWRADLEIVSDKSVVDDSVGVSGTLNPTYYHQYSINFGYCDQDISVITAAAKIGSYTQLGSTKDINAGATYGSTSPDSAWVDAGTGKVSYQTFTLTGGDERWALSSSPENKDVTNAGTISESGYYHQYMVRFGYSTLIDQPTTISGGVAGQTIGSYIQFGSSNSITPSSTRGQTNPASAFVDAGASKVSYITYTTASNTERWALSTSPHNMNVYTSGLFSEVGYYHQFQLSIEVSGLDADTTTTDTVLDLITRQFGSSTYPSFAVSDFSSAIHIFVNAHDIDTGFAFADIITSTTSGKQYAWAATTGTGSAADETLRGGTFDLVAASTLSVTYKAQWAVTFSQTGIGSDAGSETVLTVGTTNYAYDELPSGWFDDGTTFTWKSTISGGSGKQFVKTSDSGPASPITASGTSIVTYKTQYYVTFDQTGLDDTATGIILTIHGVTKTAAQLPYSDWLDHTATYDFSDPVSSSTPGKRFELYDFTGSFVPDGTVTGNYGPQWLVSFHVSGLDSDAGTNTVLTVGSDTCDYVDFPVESVWVDDGTSYSWADPITISGTEKFVQSAGSDGAITAAGTISASYQKQWKITFAQTGVGTDFTGTVVNVDSSNYDVDDLASLSFWWNDASTHSFAFSSPLSASSSKQYFYASTTGGLTTAQSVYSFSVSTAGSIIGDYETTEIDYTGATSGVYSDPVIVSALVTKTSGSVEGVEITFTIGSQTVKANTNAGGVALTSITLNQPSGSYIVTASCGGVDSTILRDSESFTINKDDATVEYTGDEGTVTTAEGTETITVRFAATVTQDDGYDGDLGLVTLEFTIDSGTAGGFSGTVHNVPVNSAGQAVAFLEGIPVDAYSIEVRIESDNSYWTGEPDVDNVLAVCPSDGDGYVTGGGWIPSEDSINGKINFAFVVHYDRRGNPKGSFVAVFKSADGFTYRIKSTSWAKASLTFGTDDDNSYATLTVNGVVQKIDRTGTVDASWGNCMITVDLTDGDYGINQNECLDKIAVTVYDNTYTILHQWGTKASQIGIGGGNIVVATAGKSSGGGSPKKK